MSYIDKLPDSAKVDQIRQIHEQKQQWVEQNKKGFLRYRIPFEALKNFPATEVYCDQGTVTIGNRVGVSPEDRQIVEHNLRSFMPWRKGPFSVYGIYIDSEWQSQRKWQRLLPKLPDLNDKIVADVGCSNGYYMFRMVPHKPKLVIGFAPSVQHYYCFKGLNSMAGQKNLEINLLGV